MRVVLLLLLITTPVFGEIVVKSKLFQTESVSFGVNQSESLQVLHVEAEEGVGVLSRIPLESLHVLQVKQSEQVSVQFVR